ncbi:DUF6169 family protein [Hymenobacter sp. BT635]|uniref:DUF6169 family protein n=1 Tax=Hymenobacter nitidus TaxID=2880929 RepID=A0ABS8AJC1_9BACT|nr:DUF6169 family protein [Hymenobacter nitidus]MCB2379782.1 DUF6169 family protein [Hymenobacter nitidus]
MFDPYSITVEEGSTYSFVTQHSVQYQAYFLAVPTSEAPEIDGLIFTFSFVANHEACDFLPPSDYRVKATLRQIIRDFLAKDSERVLCFTCDSNDGKHHKRQITFERWHNEEDPQKQYYYWPFSIPAPSEDEHPTLGGYFIHKDHPMRGVIQEHFVESVMMFTDIKTQAA